MLADDDDDDRIFFEEALEDLPISVDLTTVEDGEQLMHFLNEKPGSLPDVLFLDLNMPRKTGFECLIEIKSNPQFKSIPVIIFSTTIDSATVNSVYNSGAQYYIRKPAEFTSLKNVLSYALSLIAEKNLAQPSKENFILEGDFKTVSTWMEKK